MYIYSLKEQLQEALIASIFCTSRKPSKDATISNYFNDYNLIMFLLDLYDGITFAKNKECQLVLCNYGTDGCW